MAGRVDTAPADLGEEGGDVGGALGGGCDLGGLGRNEIKVLNTTC